MALSRRDEAPAPRRKSSEDEAEGEGESKTESEENKKDGAEGGRGTVAIRFPDK